MVVERVGAASAFFDAIKAERITATATNSVALP
jgi:hypothetical protein